MDEKIIKLDIVKTQLKDYFFLDLSSHPHNHGKYMPVGFSYDDNSNTRYPHQFTLNIIQENPKIILRPSDLNLTHERVGYHAIGPTLDIKISECSLQNLIEQGGLLNYKSIRRLARKTKRETEEAVKELEEAKLYESEWFGKKYEEYYVDTQNELLSVVFFQLVKMHANKTLDYTLIRGKAFEKAYASVQAENHQYLSDVYGPGLMKAKIDRDVFKLANDRSSDNHGGGDYSILEYKIIRTEDFPQKELIFPVERLSLRLVDHHEGYGEGYFERAWNKK